MQSHGGPHGAPSSPRGGGDPQVAATLQSISRFLRWLAAAEAAATGQRVSFAAGASSLSAAAATALQTLMERLSRAVGPRAAANKHTGALPPGLLALLQAAELADAQVHGKGLSLPQVDIADAVAAAVKDVVKMLLGTCTGGWASARAGQDRLHAEGIVVLSSRAQPAPHLA